MGPHGDMAKRAQQLVTKRLVLKPLEEEDRRAVIAMCKSTEVKQTYMLPDLETEDRANGFFEKLMELGRSQEHFFYGIYAGGTFAGWVNDCGGDGNCVEFGYAVAPAYWGKGYAGEAAEACIAELFRIGYSRVEAGYFEENSASRRVMEKCGMRPVGKTEEIPYRGKKHICLYYAIEKG